MFNWKWIIIEIVTVLIITTILSLINKEFNVDKFLIGVIFTNTIMIKFKEQ